MIAQAIPTAARVLGELMWSSGPDNPARILLDQSTRMEREVLSCLVDGMDRPEMAARLKLSINTVRKTSPSVALLQVST